MENIAQKITAFIDNRSVLILGFGREGRSTYKLLRQIFPKLEICISDRNLEVSKEKKLQDDAYLSWVLGEGHMKAIPLYELVFKTPGISLSDYQKPANQEISSQTDLFLRLFSKQVIGVTGTKGKSTTVSLIYHLLKETGKESILVGNIGLPALEIIDKINTDTVIVYELSSHQLEYCRNSPHIAVFLNIFEEHLDHYISFLAYQLAKVSITKYQLSDDVFIYNNDDLILRNRVKDCSTKATKIAFGLMRSNASSHLIERGFVLNSGMAINVDFAKNPLVGKHNLLNILAAFNACEVLGLSAQELSNGLYSFKPLSHRLEFVGIYNGVKFVNDSIATIPEATTRAIESYDDVDTLILGGFNRCIDYSLLIEYLHVKEIPNLIMLGEVGNILHEQLKEVNCISNIFMAKDMDEVVRFAFQYTAKGKTCLLSPAASSYDSFKNFEDRGDQYKKKVQELALHL